jgi:hypothetical protein
MDAKLKEKLLAFKMAEEEVRKAKQNQIACEENLTQLLIDVKAWPYLKPNLSRLMFELRMLK